jgi:hypothetical protein
MIHIRDKKTDEIILKTRCSIQKIVSTYSNTKEPIFKMVIDSKPISRNNTFTVKYKCQTCNIEQEITLNLYMRKVNREISRCDACKNRDEIKCKAQSEFMKQNATTLLSGFYIKEEPIKVKNITLDKHLEKSLLDWEQEEFDFKEKYLLYHLTTDDFERFRNKIISINNDKFRNISEWNYFPTYRIYNQSRYTPMMVHKTDQIVEKPLYLKFKCDNCDDLFIHRDLEIIKNQYKLLCKTCSFTNKVFCIRKYTCKDGSTLIWQSIPERRFIKWCEDNNIILKNGPKIEYIFNDRTHIYRVDFELPQYKMLIEIKENHCWHKQQVESGKFGVKESSANEWCKKNNYTYHVVFPKTLQKMKDSILEKSL